MIAPRTFVVVVLLAAICFVPAISQQDSPNVGGWRADPQLLANLEQRNVSWLFREEKVPEYTLPDPLICADGFRVTTREDWERKRRPETLDLFRKYVYGRPPAKPTKLTFQIVENDLKALDGAATRKRVKITSHDANGKSFEFETAILVPNEATKPVPAFLLINNRTVASADPSRKQKDGFWPVEEIIARGYATAVFRTNDVDLDQKDNSARSSGVRGVWPAGGGTLGEDSWGTIAAWAWGASRVLDYLQTDQAINANKVALVGHSRGGKTALWAGAEDERFALIVSNNSGCGGAALSRRRFGETIAAINRGFPHWFCDNFNAFNNKEDELPIDQHQLIALIAPRAVYVASADADFWADQRGEFLSVAHAAPVYALYGYPGFKSDQMPRIDIPLVRGRTAYHVRSGIHNLTPYDWSKFMDFADHLWNSPVKPQK
jgi:pimeloyl-ACP methyl ester carboxylesterase